MTHQTNPANTTPKRLLLTGSEGMLGRYLREAFADFEITGMSRRDIAGCIRCDLTRESPILPPEPFDLVIHAAGTSDNDSALEVNLEGTKRLLAALEGKIPRAVIFISDAAVYGRGGGLDIDESTTPRTTDKVGQSKFLAEKEMEKWAAENGVTLTILRPAPMFGSGIGGEMRQLFEEVIRSRYIHIRGNDARRGIVCAYDVARVAKALEGIQGTFTVADGRNRTLLDLVMAMSSNTGLHKRPIFLPAKWALLGSKIPGLKKLLDPAKFKRREITLTYRNDRVSQASGIRFFDTVEVVARRDSDYPYADF